MGKNVKMDPEGVRKNQGVPLLGEVPLLENLQPYIASVDTYMYYFVWKPSPK